MLIKKIPLKKIILKLHRKRLFKNNIKYLEYKFIDFINNIN